MYTSSPKLCAPAEGAGGPFVETKELIAGYVIVSAASLEDAARWALQYLIAVEADEVDLRELESSVADPVEENRIPDALTWPDSPHR